MFKKIIGNISARLLRAAVGRIVNDIELFQSIYATSSSAALVNSSMAGAIVCKSRLEVMRTAFDAAKSDGFICELGVYRGQSLNEIARYYSPNIVHGFDTFSGLPEDWRNGFSAGAFDVRNENLYFEKNCILHKGLFDETLPYFLKEIRGPAKLIHVDCDLYSSTASALRILAPRIEAGTVIIFDEYFNYPGWQDHEYKAFHEFLECFGFNFRYISYNNQGQQVAVEITGAAA